MLVNYLLFVVIEVPISTGDHTYIRIRVHTNGPPSTVEAWNPIINTPYEILALNTVQVPLHVFHLFMTEK